jgi:hypothetical protein
MTCVNTNFGYAFALLLLERAGHQLLTRLRLVDDRRYDQIDVFGVPTPPRGGRVGTIFYGSETTIHIDDRALAHLKAVIATKLRRSETFTFSWRHSLDEPGGRGTLWIHPAIPLRFVFDDPEPAELNQEWRSRLARSANSSGGITLVPENDTGPLIVPEPPAV